MSNDAERLRSRPSPARRLRLSSAAGEAARTPTACTTCRERKIKCSGDRPCRFCSKRNLQCIILESGRRKLYPVMYVKELEQRLALQQHSPSSRSRHQPTTFDRNVPEVWRHSGEIQNLVSPEDQSLSRDSAGADVNDATEAGISNSNRDRHGDVLKSQLWLTYQSHVHCSKCKDHYPGVKLPKSPDNAYGLLIPTFHQSDVSYVQRWPTEDESQLLLDTVLNSVGRVQHLFDPRSFSDRLGMEYALDEFRVNPSDLWHAEMLMVFAVGELLSGTLQEDMRFPGERFFMESMNNLSNLSHVHAAGTQGIGLMGLIAFYLQCADRKDDAYIYAGMALRMALLMGLHRDGATTATTRSEKAHRNRLWWTIYMQERRLAAATGIPLSIQDEAIRAPYPTDTPGFYSPEPLNTNIKIAKITGQILQTIYGQTEQTEQTFVTGVRKILSALHQISRNIPAEFVLDFSRTLQVTRNSATLHLMLYQAIILATRPIVLHLARESFSGSSQAILSSGPLQQLAETCIDAAQRSLTILGALQRQGLIANFGFFDLDATFSVAFVFVLAETIYPRPHKQSGLYDIQGSLNIFRYLQGRGSKASANREADIMQMCDHLGIPRKLISNPNQATTDTSIADDLPESRFPTTSTRDLHGRHSNNEQYYLETQHTEDSVAPHVTNPDQPLHWVDDSRISETIIGQNTHDLYSLYNNDGLGLTGTVETDWEALERQIFGPQ